MRCLLRRAQRHRFQILKQVLGQVGCLKQSHKSRNNRRLWSELISLATKLRIALFKQYRRTVDLKRCRSAKVSIALMVHQIYQLVFLSCLSDYKFESPLRSDLSPESPTRKLIKLSKQRVTPTDGEISPRFDNAITHRNELAITAQSLDSAESTNKLVLQEAKLQDQRIEEEKTSGPSQPLTNNTSFADPIH